MGVSAERKHFPLQRASCSAGVGAVCEVQLMNFDFLRTFIQIYLCTFFPLTESFLMVLHCVYVFMLGMEEGGVCSSVLSLQQSLGTSEPMNSYE